MSGARFTLRFLSGKYQGGEFPLQPGHPVVIGRASDLDMVLVDDMVSRKHAAIVDTGERVELQDLESTNGVFVNGEKVKQAVLKPGDRVLIGTSILKLTALAVPSAPATHAESRRQLEATAARRRTVGIGRPMMGAIEEIPLPDLLQLLSTSRKSGVLFINGPTGLGRVFLRKGQVYHAVVDDLPALPARKALFRILAWSVGSFHVDPSAPDESPLAEEIRDSTEALLLEAMRRFDELRHLEPKLPKRSQLLGKVPLVPGRIPELTPVERDLIGLLGVSALTLEAILDRSPHQDLETLVGVASLIEKKRIKPVI